MMSSQWKWMAPKKIQQRAVKMLPNTVFMTSFKRFLAWRKATPSWHLRPPTKKLDECHIRSPSWSSIGKDWGRAYALFESLTGISWYFCHICMTPEVLLHQSPLPKLACLEISVTAKYRWRVIFDSCCCIIQLSGRNNWRKPTKSMEALYSTCGYKVHLEPLGAGFTTKSISCYWYWSYEIIRTYPNYLRKLSNHLKILATVNSTLKVAPQKMKRIATCAIWNIQFVSSSGPSSQSLNIDPPTTPDVALVALKAFTAA